MKIRLFIWIFLLLPGLLLAQSKNQNTLTVKIDGQEFTTQPRKVKMGRFSYFTGNDSKPETMFRVMLMDLNKGQVLESGTYLVVDPDKSPSKKEVKENKLDEKFKGIAAIRYVIETKAPRMRYHVGDTQNNEETVTVTNHGDGNLEITFDKIVLRGSHWKEKNAATVVGGVGRLKGKAQDNIMSKVTGYDWNIDPEGNGYRNLKDEADTITITNCKMVVKLKE